MGLSLSLQVVYLVHSISLCGEGVWFQCFHCAVTRGVSFCSSSGFVVFFFFSHSDIQRVRGKSLLNLVVKATKKNLAGGLTHVKSQIRNPISYSLIKEEFIVELIKFPVDIMVDELMVRSVVSGLHDI